MFLLGIFFGIFVSTFARNVCTSVNVSTVVMTDQRYVTDQISIVFTINSDSSLTVSNFVQWHANASSPPFPRPIYTTVWTTTDFDLTQSVYPNFHEGPGEVWFFNYYQGAEVEQLGFPLPLPLIGNSFYLYNGQLATNQTFSQPGLPWPTPVTLQQTVTCLNKVDVGVTTSGSPINCNSFTGISDFSISGVSKASMQVDYTFQDSVLTATISKATIFETDLDSQFVVVANMNPYQNDYSNFVPQLIPGCWGSLKGCSFFFNVSEYAGNANEFGYLFAILYSESQSYSAVNAEFVHSNGMWIVGGTQAFSENKKCFVHTDVSGGVLSNTTFCCTNVIGTENLSTTTPTGGTAASPSTQQGNNASTSNIFSAIFLFMLMFLGLKLNNQLLLITIFACLTSSTFAVPVCTDVSVAMSVVDSNNQTIDALGINLQLIQFGPNVYIMSMYNFVQSHQNTNENFSMPRYILFGANIYNISNNNNNYTFGGIADGPGYLWIQRSYLMQSGPKKNLKDIFKPRKNAIIPRTYWTIPMPIANGGFYKVTGDLFTQANGCYQSSSFDQEYFYNVCCTKYAEANVLHQNDKIDCQEFQSVTQFGYGFGVAELTYEVKDTQVIATITKGYQLIFDYTTFFVFNINYDIIAQEVSGFGPFATCATTGKGCRLIVDIDKNNDVILQPYISYTYNRTYFGSVTGGLVRRSGTWLKYDNQVFTLSNPCYGTDQEAATNVEAYTKFCCTRLTNGTYLNLN